MFKSKEEKRHFPRWEVSKRIEYGERERGPLRSYTKDISLTGASIFVVGQLPSARDHVRLKIHLTDDEHVEVQGRIVWTRLEAAHKLFGICFEPLSRKVQQLITRLAFDLGEDHLLMNALTQNLILKTYFSPENSPSTSSHVLPPSQGLPSICSKRHLSDQQVGQVS